MPSKKSPLTPLSPAEAAVGQFAHDLIENNQLIVGQLVDYRRSRGKNGVPSWDDYCYVPINVAQSVTQWHFDAEVGAGRCPADRAEIRAMHLAREICGVLAWAQKRTSVTFPAGFPIMRDHESAKVDPELLLALPEYGVYLPARGQPTLFESPVIGTIAFVDHRFTRQANMFPELNLLALIDMSRFGVPLYVSASFCAVIHGITYAQAVARACSLADAPAKVKRDVQRQAARFVARIAGDLEVIARTGLTLNPAGQRTERHVVDGKLWLSDVFDMDRLHERAPDKTS